jgi:hypothetical protein
MNSLWDSLYDRFKDCRYGALFLAAVLAFFGLLILGSVAYAIVRGLGAEEYFLDALPGIGLLGLAWAIVKFRRAQIRGREKSQYAPLSRDELRVARSKLRNGMAGPKRPAPRVPDMDLRY